VTELHVRNLGTGEVVTVEPATKSGPGGWKRINLADERYAVKPEPPAWGLIYRGKRHKISGPPESAKTLIAYALLLEAVRSGATVAAIDFELGPEATRLMLEELGFTLEQIRQVHYFEPDTEPGIEEIEWFVYCGIDIVLIDALAGAYEASGLDDNKRKEVEQWQRIWTKPLYQAGIATILNDHVVKNADARGDWSIGSERKAGTVDVHLGLEVTKKLGRGTTGLYKAHIRKDRPAFLRAGGIREIEIQSHPDTHAITWAIRETGATAAGEHWQPTVLMERVAAFLAGQPDPVTRNTVERGVRGKSAKYVRQAIDELITAGYIEQQAGARGAQLVRLVKSYTTASDRVPTASDALTSTASTASSAYGTTQTQTQSATAEDPDAVDDDTWLSSITDEELERLAADHADIVEGSA
jgi:hypothetical protein